MYLLVKVLQLTFKLMQKHCFKHVINVYFTETPTKKNTLTPSKEKNGPFKDLLDLFNTSASPSILARGFFVIVLVFLANIIYFLSQTM